jgi:MFS family permease
VKAFPDIVGWWSALDQPLRRLPRWAAALLLTLTVALCVWSGPAEYHYGHHAAAVNRARLKRGDRRDMDLYQTIDERVARGESYWHAALAEQRKSRYPTRPFIAVRPPTLAWATVLVGLTGWRVIAIGLWFVTVFGMIFVARRRTHMVERLGAAAGAGLFGTVAFIPQVGLSHEILAGVFLSAALAIYRPQRWWPALLLAAFALALRELALPFVLLWAAFAASQRRWREFAAVAAVIALFALGMWLHSNAVLAERLPGDLKSPGWTGMQGLPFTLYGLMSVTPLGKYAPWWLGPPLLVLPLLGWAALGGRTGLFASLWFGGFLLAVSLFARQENFYWLSLVLPAYGAGIAFVPRALYDLIRALRRPRRAADGGFQAA